MWPPILAACTALASGTSVDLTALASAATGAWNSPAWTTRAVRGSRAPTATIIDSAGQRFVRIAGAAQAAFFVHKLSVPYAAAGARLSWVWRAPKAPGTADMRAERTDDSPLRVFVVFQTAGLFRRTPRTLFYSAGTHEPDGFSRASFTSNDLQVLRIATNTDGAVWTETSVQPATDYTRIWGGPVPCVVAVGVMQDTDQTHLAAIADVHSLVWRSSNVSSR